MKTGTTPQPAIIRAIKLNSMSKIGASAGHTWRTTPVAHADANRTHLNQDWRPISSPEQLRTALQERLALADNVKNNSVLLIEYVVSAAHNAFIEQGGNVQWQSYFEDSLAFLEAHHSADNIIGVNIQLDERTPHLVVYAVPIVDYPAATRSRNVILGKENGQWVRGLKSFDVAARTALSASHFMGSREKLRELQTNFAQEVGARHGLCRGLRYSAATHVTTKSFHQTLTRGLAANLELTTDDLARQWRLWGRESLSEHAARLTDTVIQHYAPTVAQASTADIQRRRADEMTDTARRTESALDTERRAHRRTRERLDELVGSLSTQEVRQLEAFSQQCRQQHRENEAIRKKAEAQRLEAARLEQQKLEDQQAEQLRNTSPDKLAQLDIADRSRAWRLAIARDDLELTLERWMESGFFNIDGTLIEKIKNFEKQIDKPKNASTQAVSDELDIHVPLIESMGR
jgi:hypothetical protein